MGPQKTQCWLDLDRNAKVFPKKDLVSLPPSRGREKRPPPKEYLRISEERTQKRD